MDKIIFTISDIILTENIPQYIERNMTLSANPLEKLTLIQKIIGNAGPYKEGDEQIGVATDNELNRKKAQILLSNTDVKFFQENSLYQDELQKSMLAVNLLKIL
jgi:ethanolamine ammonia-lyase large subunit